MSAGSSVLWKLESLSGDGTCTSKMADSLGWQVGAGSRLGDSVSLYRAAWGIQRKTYNTFFDQSSDVTSSHLHPSLLVEAFTKVCPDCRGREIDPTSWWRNVNTTLWEVNVRWEMYWYNHLWIICPSSLPCSFYLVFLFLLLFLFLF